MRLLHRQTQWRSPALLGYDVGGADADEGAGGDGLARLPDARHGARTSRLCGAVTTASTGWNRPRPTMENRPMRPQDLKLLRAKALSGAGAGGAARRVECAAVGTPVGAPVARIGAAAGS